VRWLKLPLVVTAVFCVQSLSSTQAASSLEQACKRIYFVGDLDVPAQAAEYMRSNNDVAARYCAFPEIRIDSYWSISPVWKGYSGVCLFDERPRRLFEESERAPSKNIYMSKNTYMTLARGDCPKQDDPQYVFTMGVSQGTFVALEDLISRITSTRRNLDSALAVSRADLAEVQKWGDFKADLLSRESSKQLKIKSIMLMGYDRDLLSREDHDLYTYQLDLVQPNGMRGWTLYVDASPRGFRIVNISVYLLSYL
jgi:hypothetical protein